MDKETLLLENEVLEAEMIEQGHLLTGTCWDLERGKARPFYGHVLEAVNASSTTTKLKVSIDIALWMHALTPLVAPRYSVGVL